MSPLFSIITPCDPRRYESTLPRAIASVDAQTFGDWEHVLVFNADSEFPSVRPHPRRRLVEAPANPGWRDRGAWNFKHGTEVARGAYLAYLCDDDEHLPHHLALHLAELQKGADFTVSRTAFYLRGDPQFEVGDGSFELSHLDSNGVVNRRELNQIGNWRDTGRWDADWDMVSQWRQAGREGVFIDVVTGIHHNGWLARSRGIADD